jgi:predicted flavoprotein YhiN
LIETLQLENKNWADASKQEIRKLSLALCAAEFSINGKSTNKDEFVTCGGIDLNEIDFKKMKVKKYDNLYAAGEVMNIDAVTGGFNFQNAWTSGFISANAIIDSIDN